MPELPEVESVRRDLIRRRLRGRRIVRVRGSGKPLRMNRPVPLAGLGRAARGRRIVALERLGKYLLLGLDGGPQLLCHLGMSGNLLIVPRRQPWAPHTHVVFELDDGRDLRFVDPRRFGLIDVCPRAGARAHPALAGLGVDPIAEGLPDGYLWTKAQRRTAGAKALLLDQHVVAGVGNIYASEVLWLARIAPGRPARRLGPDGARALSLAIDEVLRFAIDNGGTTLRDFVGAGGEPGENGEYLLVYGRDGTPCPRCRTKVRRRVDQGRATYFCPTCQKR
ncbi:MAG: bifunctional DNA-formamidopyrimidine glycosylase/DNA-(apurinic or apyrimidinic site) lyase [Kofleriaceae bacterium]|nr:bifunctional DNA-formamidopyrimidine glycosylase/DNA-(apurinic or apyrimidinic site) lyase [Kofleriaceae bacterium]MCL4224097.1 bifunctional DNA-formamidopyrimidine glycosylase/DNA-(apurinic or apyrimidinic site) lyase [Myxococcales bacterium]